MQYFGNHFPVDGPGHAHDRLRREARYPLGRKPLLFILNFQRWWPLFYAPLRQWRQYFSPGMLPPEILHFFIDIFLFGFGVGEGILLGKLEPRPQLRLVEIVFAYEKLQIFLELFEEESGEDARIDPCL